MRASGKQNGAGSRNAGCMMNHAAARGSTAGRVVTRHAQFRFSRVDEKAIDSAPLQRVAELKAFCLVREGSDLQAIKGAEIAHVGLLDVWLKPGELLVLLCHLLPELFRLGLGARGAELQPVISTTD